MNNNQLQHTETLISEITTFEQPADVVLSRYFKTHKKLGRQDRHEIAETAFAALRHWQKISSFLADKKQHPKYVALCAMILGRDLSIQSFNDLIDDDEKAMLSELKAQKKTLNQDLCNAAELPMWLIETLKTTHSEEDILRLGQAMASTAPLDMRVNTRMGKRDKVLATLQAENLNAKATPFSPWGIRLQEKIAINRHPLFENGTLEVQDEGSQLLALLLGAKRNEIIVDFCAGAGGKTLAIGAMMNNTGRIYAFDVAEKRLANIKPRLVRSGLTNINPQRISTEHDSNLERLFGKVDRVLVDAPCSGLGTLRRNPDLKYRQSKETLANLVQLQASILQAASNLVKIGGRLVYATCSVLPAENQEQVDSFLANNSNFKLLDASALLSQAKIDLNTGHYLTLNPAKHQTDGFFAAVLERIS